MKNFMKLNFMLVMMAGLIFTTSCGDDDNEVLVVTTPEDEFDARINNNLTDSLTATVFVSDVTDGEINVLLSFTSAEDMTRIYITENRLGAGDEKLDASDAFGVNDKGDGSIDLSSDFQNSFQFELTFNTADLPSEGTIIYNFWATAGKGDFRDQSKRLAEGPAVLTINLGGNNPETVVKSYTTKVLAAPLADGSSETFISLLDGQLYKISDGDEFSAFWDFGYFYGSDAASLASTSEYEVAFGSAGGVPFVDVDGIAGTTDLNNAYFALSSSFTSDDFDGIAVAADLDAISTPSSESINNLQVGDIIEFVDNYGKKGLIRVVQIVGTFNSTDFIEIDIKVQP
jgi:hypothetical protein